MEQHCGFTKLFAGNAKIATSLKTLYIIAQYSIASNVSKGQDQIIGMLSIKRRKRNEYFNHDC